MRIEARKRRRVLLDEDGEGDGGSEVSFGVGEDGEGQVVVRAGFEDADEELERNDEGVDWDEEKEGLDDEVHDLQELRRLDEEGFHAFVQKTRKRWIQAGLGLHFLKGGEYSNPLLDQYSQDEPSAESEGFRLRNRREKTSSVRPKSALTSQRVTRAASAGSNKSVRFEEQDEATTPSTEVDPDEDEDDEDDEDFDPTVLEDEDSTDVDESDKENTEPPEGFADYGHTSDSTSSSGSDTSIDDENDQDDTSSSGTSSSDSESDSESEPSKSPSKAQKTTTVNGRSSSSSSPSSADSSMNKENVKPKSATISHPPVPPGAGKFETTSRNIRRRVHAAMTHHKAEGDLSEDATIEDLIRLKEQTLPHLPFWAQRTRAALQMTPVQATADESGVVEEAQEDQDSIAAKRKELLDSLQSAGGLDVTSSTASTDAAVSAVHNEPGDQAETKTQKRKKAKAAKKAAEAARLEAIQKNSQEGKNDGVSASQTVQNSSESAIVQVPDSFPEARSSTHMEPTEVQATQTPMISLTPADQSASPGSAPSGSQRPRSRLDLASSKRMLFGSLGLKAPKNKDDESALREKLMKDVRTTKPVKERVAEIEAAEATFAPAEDDTAPPEDNSALTERESAPLEDDDDSWREKTEVYAVECCHEGVQYSAPPFPFVQRWDPQQQGDSKGTGKQKKGREKRKRKWRARKHYGEDGEDLSPEQGSPSKVARQESYDVHGEQVQFDDAAFEHDQAQQSQELSGHHHFEDSAAASEQLLRESSECAAYEAAHSKQDLGEEIRDLPALPNDLSKYEALKKEHCSAGAIITFQRLLMSAETNWQPGMSGNLTAEVRELDDNGTLLMTLAKRDQPKDKAQYDEETGERVYAKFEMPGYDDENAESDRSRLELPFNELIGARLIRAAAGKDHSGSNEHRISTASDPDETLVGDEAQRTTTEPHAAASFDSFMDHPPPSQIEASLPFEPAPPYVPDPAQSSYREANQGSDSEDSSVGGDASSPVFHTSSSSRFTGGKYSASSPLSVDAQAKQTGKAPEGSAGLSSTNEDPFAMSPHTAVVEYPTLPQSHEESGSIQNQRQHRSVSLNSETRAASPDFVSPPPTRREKGQGNSSPKPEPHSQESEKADAKPISTLDGANDSSDEFPELFSQAFDARMSQDPIVKDESIRDDALHSLPKATGSAGSFKKSINKKTSQKNRLLSFDEEDVVNNDSSYRPSQSEVFQSSQIVDLTMSSDPADSRFEETGDMSSYQSSGGWVDKSNASLDLPVGKRSVKRKTRSSATMAY